jgi:outer membrane protein OmpA-like peptidoglycan-associated protein
MKSFITVLFLAISVASFSQRNQKKLESSFDLGIGNHFGLRQIQDGFNVNSFTVSNMTLGWNNYFTNNKFGGRLELSYDKMLNNSSSQKFETNYFRTTYYLNSSMKSLVGWGGSKTMVDKRNFWQAFDIDLGMGIGYSAMKSKTAPLDETAYLKRSDDMLNISFRIAPSLQLSDELKLFAAYTRINHSAQSSTFDFSHSIENTAFKGAFRTLNVGLRYTPNSKRTYDRSLKDTHRKWHFFTSFDAALGNHFAGATEVESAKFKGGSIGHLNLGANHKFPNSKLFGRFDLGFDAFKNQKSELAYSTKYFRATYQVIADLRTLRGMNNESNKMDLAFGLGLGFATMYNSESTNNLDDVFLNGDDMYALVFNVNPSYRISNALSLIANGTFTSHSLQSNSWNMQNSQSNTAFNGRMMNFSLGLRYHMADRRTNYTSALTARIPKIWSVDAAMGSHFLAAPLSNNYALSASPVKHVAVGLNHPFINPVYFGRFEFAFDALTSSKSSLDFSSKYFRANYFLMTSIQNQLSKSTESTYVPKRFDVQFGLGVGASTFKTAGHNDYFISKGDDMLNLAAKVVPTYKVSEKVSVFAAYTFVAHSLQSQSYDMNQSVSKSMFNGHLMNASVGVSIALKSTKPRLLVDITPVDTTSNVAVVVPDPIAVDTIPADTLNVVTPVVIPDPVVTPDPTPTVLVETRTYDSTISDYPVNMSDLPASQKAVLKDLVDKLKGNDQLSLVLSGHADKTGAEGYNLSLSRKRAANVKAYLISQGIQPERIKIEYYGTSKPIASNETIEGRKKNRRVDIDIVDTPKK